MTDQMTDRMNELLEECGIGDIKVIPDKEFFSTCPICFRATNGDLEKTQTQVSPANISHLIESNLIVLNGCMSSGSLNKVPVTLFGINRRGGAPDEYQKLFIAVQCDWEWTLNKLHTALEKQRQAQSSRSATTTTIAAITAIIAIAAIAVKKFLLNK